MKNFSVLKHTKLFIQRRNFTKFNNKTKSLYWFDKAQQCLNQNQLNESIIYLKHSLLETHDDIVFRGRVTMELAWCLDKVQRVDEAADMIRQARSYAYRLPYLERCALDVVDAVIHIRLGDFETAFELTKGLPTDFETYESHSRWSNLYYTLGLAFFGAHQYKAAINNLKIALNLVQKNDLNERVHQESLLKVINALADAYYYEGMYNEAILYYKCSLNLTNTLFGNNSCEYATCLMYLAEVQLRNLEFKEAFKSANESRAVMKKDKLDKNLLNVLLRGITVQIRCYLKWKNYEKAIALIESSMSLAKKNNQIVRQIELLHQLADVKIQLKNFEDAEQILMQRQLLIEKLSPFDALNSQIGQYNALSKLYEAQQNYEKASKVIEEGMKYYKQVFSPGSRRMLNTFEHLIMLYNKIGNLEKIEKTIEEVKKQGTPTYMMKKYLVEVYMEKRKFGKALVLLNEMMEQVEEQQNEHMHFCLVNLKECYSQLGETEAVMKCEEKLNVRV